MMFSASESHKEAEVRVELNGRLYWMTVSKRSPDLRKAVISGLRQFAKSIEEDTRYEPRS